MKNRKIQPNSLLVISILIGLFFFFEFYQISDLKVQDVQYYFEYEKEINSANPYIVIPIGNSTQKSLSLEITVSVTSLTIPVNIILSVAPFDTIFNDSNSLYVTRIPDPLYNYNDTVNRTERLYVLDHVIIKGGEWALSISGQNLTYVPATGFNIKIFYLSINETVSNTILVKDNIIFISLKTYLYPILVAILLILIKNKFDERNKKKI